MYERAMHEARKEQERRRRIHTASPHLPVVIHGDDELEPAPGVEDPVLLAILSVVIVLATVVVLVTSL
jgi:hypothetical protein